MCKEQTQFKHLSACTYELSFKNQLVIVEHVPNNGKPDQSVIQADRGLHYSIMLVEPFCLVTT